MTIKYLILKFIFFIIEKTCSWKYHNIELFDKLYKSDKPIIICIWHGFFIFPMFFLRKHYIQTKVVSSTHADSMILARVLKDYGFNLIKGSSTRGAKNVIFFENYKQTIELLMKNINILGFNKQTEINEKNIYIDNNFKKLNYKFDLVFLDPPFKDKNLKIILENLETSKILDSKTLIVVHRNKKIKEKIYENFKIVREETYGTSKIIFGFLIF